MSNRGGRYRGRGLNQPGRRSAHAMRPRTDPATGERMIPYCPGVIPAGTDYWMEQALADAHDVMAKGEPCGPGCTIQIRAFPLAEGLEIAEKMFGPDAPVQLMALAQERWPDATDLHITIASRE